MPPLLSVVVAQQPKLSAVFWRTRTRANRPMVEGRVVQAWMWEPARMTNVCGKGDCEATNPLGEGAGVRLVPDFEKTHMTVSDPGSDPVNQWSVSNNLLAKEPLTEKLPLDQNQCRLGRRAQMLVAGDLNDRHGPSDATLAPLLGYQPSLVGMMTTQGIDRNGRAGAGQALAPSVRATPVHVWKMNLGMASIFGDCLNARGTVSIDGVFRDEWLFANSLCVTGLPLPEVSWPTVVVRGVPKRVLVQVFERCVPTYTLENPQSWRCEAGSRGLDSEQGRDGQLGQQPVSRESAQIPRFPSDDTVVPTLVQVVASLEPLKTVLRSSALAHSAWQVNSERRRAFIYDCGRVMRGTVPPPPLFTFHIIVRLDRYKQGAANVQCNLERHDPVPMCGCLMEARDGVAIAALCAL